MRVRYYEFGIEPLVLEFIVVDDFGNELEVTDFWPVSRQVQACIAAFDFATSAGANPCISEGELH